MNSKDKVDNALARATDTKACCVRSGALDATPELVGRWFSGAKAALVVCDPRTRAAAGEKVEVLLKAAGYAVSEHVLEPSGKPFHAEMPYVDEIQAALASARAKNPDTVPVAVGSGVVNDCTKLASGRLGAPYAVCGTAASMDGYAAYGASITYNGAKQTFSCPAPRLIVLDVDVISAAPSGLMASGYADLFAKVPAGADWILADALGVEPIEPVSWATVQDGLAAALGDPEGLAARDKAAYSALTEGLVLGGFAMQALKSSRVASGAEHQFSHLWDMEHHVHNGDFVSHGCQVGVGTHYIAGLYERLLAYPVAGIDSAKAAAAWPTLDAQRAAVKELFADSDALPVALAETEAKYIDAAAVAAQIETLKRVWPGLKARLEKQLVPQAEIARRLKVVGAPVLPEDISISQERMKRSIRKAQAIRRRFTVLDVVLRAGLWDELA